jgi:hypothetical protein
MATPILNITECATGQVDQFVIYNEALRLLEKATQGFALVDFSAGDVPLTLDEFRAVFLFRSSGNTVARDFTLPANKRSFAVHNNGSATLSIKLGSTTLTLAAGASANYYSDGTTNGLMKIG